MEDGAGNIDYCEKRFTPAYAKFSEAQMSISGSYMFEPRVPAVSPKAFDSVASRSAPSKLRKITTSGKFASRSVP